MRFKRFLGRWLKRAGLALGMACVALLSALLTMRVLLLSKDVSVPSLLGQRMGAAAALLAERQLQIRLEARRSDAQVPEGHVAAQDPPPGAMLKTHRSVRVWLSAGPRRLAIPAVQGESLRTARLKLEQAGLPVEHVVEVEDPAPEGVVIVQQPPPGEVEELRSVGLLVSRGAAGVDYVMPDLIGRPAGDMIEVLRRAGVRVADVSYRSYPGVSAGTVLRQTPAAGHRVNLRTPVSLVVSQAS